MKRTEFLPALSARYARRVGGSPGSVIPAGSQGLKQRRERSEKRRRRRGGEGEERARPALLSSVLTTSKRSRSLQESRRSGTKNDTAITRGEKKEKTRFSRSSVTVSPLKEVIPTVPDAVRRRREAGAVPKDEDNDRTSRRKVEEKERFRSLFSVHDLHTRCGKLTVPVIKPSFRLPANASTAGESSSRKIALDPVKIVSAVSKRASRLARLDTTEKKGVTHLLLARRGYNKPTPPRCLPADQPSKPNTPASVQRCPTPPRLLSLSSSPPQ